MWQKFAKVPWYYWWMVHLAKLNKVLTLNLLTKKKKKKTLNLKPSRGSYNFTILLVERLQTRVWPVQRVHAQQYINDYLEIHLHMFCAFVCLKTKSTNEQRQNDKYHLHTHNSQSRPRPFCSYNQYSLSFVLSHFRLLSLSLSFSLSFRFEPSQKSSWALISASFLCYILGSFESLMLSLA